MEEQLSRISIPQGMWIAFWKPTDGDGTFIATGNTYSEAMEEANRMGATNPVIKQNLSGKACVLNGLRI